MFLDDSAQGGPEDFAGVVAFPPSEARNFITGQTIYLDGGRTIL
jgi:NAD(P)-dependent dehydrogenase (short-subunit alcohol dehydrogenase family)